jgi:hypothetical protein
VSFCTAVNCIDGRVQVPVIRYLQEQYGVRYVDVVTEPGPVRALAEPSDSETKRSVLRRVRVSIEAHGSELIAVVAHAECAGNPVDDEEQRQQLARSAEYLAESFPVASVIGLWVDDGWTVHPALSLREADRDE